MLLPNLLEMLITAVITSLLQQLLDVFIKKFILCTECENPETTLFPNEKKGIIRQTCKACGHQTQLNMRHKLTTFILKNPPGASCPMDNSSHSLWYRLNIVVL